MIVVERLITASTARVSSRAYGSAARICCCARTIRDDAMSSCARVILAMDWTVPIRRLTRRSWAPMGYFFSAFAGWAFRLACAGWGFRRAIVSWPSLLQRLGRLVFGAEQLAGAGLESLAELLDRVLERGDGVLGQVERFPDRLQDAGVRPRQEVKEIALEPADVLDRHVIQVPVAARPDRHHLVLHRERVVLRLLEQLDQPRAPVELRPGGRVEVGGERGERLQVAVLRQG